MCAHVKPGGLVLSLLVPQQAVQSMEQCVATPEQSPGTAATGSMYYKNVTSEEFPAQLLKKQFNQFKFFTNDYANDLYFCGFKTGDSLPDVNILKIQEQVNHMQTLGHLFASLWGGSEDDVRDNIILDHMLSLGDDVLNQHLVRDSLPLLIKKSTARTFSKIDAVLSATQHLNTQCYTIFYLRALYFDRLGNKAMTFLLANRALLLANHLPSLLMVVRSLIAFGQGELQCIELKVT